MAGKTRAMVNSRELSALVNAHGDAGLPPGCVGAEGIERGQRAVGGAQEAVNRNVSVVVPSCDGADLVDAVRPGTLAEFQAGARRIERGERPIRSAQKAVLCTTSVNVVSRDRTAR